MRKRLLMPMAALLILAACSKGATESNGPTPGSSATSAFCSTLQQFADELGNDTNGATNAVKLVETVQRQATTAASVLGSQEDDMDLATRTHADAVIADVNALAMWTPDQLPTTYTDVIKKFGDSSTAFASTSCAPRS